MPITKLTTKTSTEFLEANQDALVLLVFDAEFSGQQDIVDETLKHLQEFSDLQDKIVIATVDVEANNDLATKFNVISVPTVACIKGNKILKKIDTLEPNKIVTIVLELIKGLELVSGGESVEQPVDVKARFQEYLKKLTSRAPVMVFMKGAPKQPRCGFSKQLVEMLAKHDIEYESFDILLDEEVRQGLKEYSDWPTYPQIYVKGEFIGGLDILKQMEESGELDSTLKFISK